MLPDLNAPIVSASSRGPETRTFGELLIDLEEDNTARAMVGLLAEMERNGSSRRRTASRPWSQGASAQRDHLARRRDL
jgi:hypothetical protein